MVTRISHLSPLPPTVRITYLRFTKHLCTLWINNTLAPHAIAYELPQFGHIIRLKLEICEDYINFDYPSEPIVSDEQIEKLLKEKRYY